MSNPPSFFSATHLRVGWSVAWRVWLVTLGLEALAIVLVAVGLALREPSTDLDVVRARFAQVRAISSWLVLIAVIPVYHWAGRVALRKRNLPVPQRFIGWAIYWRGLGLALLACLGIVVLFSVVITALGLPKVFQGVLLIGTMALCVAVILYAYGWATLRVTKNS